MIGQLKSIEIGFVRLSMNGMLLDQVMLMKIIQFGLDSIEFSFAGTNPEKNDEIRVGGDYQKVSLLIKHIIALKHYLKSATPRVIIDNFQIPTEQPLQT